MTPSPPRLRILSVGGNAVSAFLSWRLQATNACDVTLVWKANYQAVAQYGISFKSHQFGNERFKPRYVVQNPEDAASREAAFDYVLLCVKALPDVYNLADIIESVVTPQHTCILVNTTNTLGVEQQLEQRFPTNVVLSLVSGADLVQVGSSEFEQSGSTEVWVGPANVNSTIPEAIQNDMSEALAMTLSTGQVDCKVSSNIRQQQYERMIGPIAFHPTSVLFETPVLGELLQKPGVRELISDVMDELLQLAAIHECVFPQDFRDKTIRAMIVPTTDASTMYQDYLAKRPMEVETYLGAPRELAKKANIKVPRIETLYAMLHHVNSVNRDRPPPASPALSRTQPPVRIGSQPPPPRSMNGNPRPMLRPNMPMSMGPPMGRRGPPPVNGYRGPPNSYPPRGPPSNQISRRPSFDENNLDEFSHVVLYDDIPEGGIAAAYDGQNGGSMNVRERELMLREKEIRLRQQEMAMQQQRGMGMKRASHNRHRDFDDDDDDDDGYFDPTSGPPPPPIDPDNFDMMSVTSRRNKKAPPPSQGQLRKNMFEGGGGGGGGNVRPGSYARPGMRNQRSSAIGMSDIPLSGTSILDNPMMSFASNRYANVDRKEMADESRASSLTASRMQEIGYNGGPYPPPSRRTSRSPGNPFGPPGRNMGRPSPPNDGFPNGGMPRNGRPSPPGMQAPVARYPPGQGNMVHPHQVEQQAGVSKPSPPPKAAIKSLTGSASASAGSGDSGSAHIESEPSAHSSTSSFAPRPIMAMH